MILRGLADSLPGNHLVGYSSGMILCQRCGESNPAKAKFCMECGSRLVREETSMPDEIRFLTMLFADIKGFTAMSNRLSPDQLKEILEECFSQLTRVVQNQSGQIVKFEGDCIIAAFGLEKSSGMDPVNACFAALEMQRELDNFSDSLEREKGFRLEMRIGLHCGQVVVGMLGGRLDILGDAVNLTARMEQNAPAGEVLITHDLAVQLRDRFLLSPVAPLAVKGKEEPVKVHILKGEAPFLRRKILDRKTRFIGRDQELVFMAEFFENCKNTAKPGVLLFQSSPGCGKSRLLAEFEATIGERFQHLIFLHCVFSPNLTMNIQILRSFLQISRNIASREDLLEHLRRLFPGEEPAVLNSAAINLATLLGLRLAEDESIQAIKTNPEEIWRKALGMLNGIFSRMVARSPVLVLLDDIQWIDEGSVRVLQSMVQNISGPLCVIAMGRPGKTGSDLISGNSEAIIRDLEPLENDKALELVNELLSTLPDIPPSLVDQVTTIAHGNPFFIEEVIINLRDREVIRKQENKWSIDAVRLRDLEIPANVEMIVQARLDLLPRPDLELLKKASVMGRSFFWEPVARREGGRLPSEGISDFLNRGLILIGNDDPELGFRQYRFSHEIIREVLYSRLTRRQKQSNHLVMAEWFQSLNLGEDIVLKYVSYHFEHGGRLLDATKSAIRAGCLALRRFQSMEACNYFAQAERLWQKNTLNLDGEIQLEFLESYSEALLLEGKPEKVLELLDQLAVKVEETSAHSIRVRLKKLEALEKIGNDEPWKTLLQDTEKRLKNVGAGNRVERKRLQAGFAFRKGEYFRLHRQFRDARDNLNKSLIIAEELHDKWNIALCHKSLGVISFHLDDRGGALEHHRYALIALEELNNREAVQTYLDNAAKAYRIKLDLDQSLNIFEIYLADFRLNGEKAKLASCLNYLGVIYRYKQEYEKSLAYSNEALEIRKELGDLYGQTLCLGNLGMALRSLGRSDASRKIFEEALKISEFNEDPQGISYFLISLSTLLQLQNCFEKAIGYLRRAYVLRKKLGDDGMLLPLEDEIRSCIQKRQTLKNPGKN